MTAADLLTTLRKRGLNIAADGDALVVRPRDLLTDELRLAIHAHKRALLAELPRYRWLILEADGRRREVCCLPELDATELARCYPGARFVPLPDGAMAALAVIQKQSEIDA
jgi:hypothetical protein